MDAGPAAEPPTGDDPDGSAPSPPPSPGPGPRRLYREPEDKKLAGICGGLADYTGVDPALVRAGAVLLTVIAPVTVVAYLIAIAAIDERPPSVPRVVSPPVEVLERHRWLPLVIIAAAVLAGAGGRWWMVPDIDIPLLAPVLIAVGVWMLVRGRDAPSGPFAGSTAPAQNVAEPRSQKSWSSDSDLTNLSLGVDITTRNEESEHTADRTVDLRDAAGDETEVGGFAPRTGSPPANEGAGPPGEFPPLTPPEWSGPAAAPAAGRSPAPAPSPGPFAPPPPGRGSQRLGLAVTAVLLIGGGAAWLLHVADVVGVDPREALAAGLVVAGLGLVLAAWRGRSRAALIPVGAVAIGALIGGEVVCVPLDAGIGDRAVTATRRGDVDEPIELLIGSLDVDLRDVPLDPRRTTEVEAGVGLGELRVLVPRDAEVVVDAHVGAGQVRGPGVGSGPGDGEEGVAVDESFVLEGREGAARLDLTLDVDLGEIEVVRG